MKDSKYIYFLRLDFKKFLILDTLSILFGEKIKEKDLKKEKKKMKRETQLHFSIVIFQVKRGTVNHHKPVTQIPRRSIILNFFILSM